MSFEFKKNAQETRWRLEVCLPFFLHSVCQKCFNVAFVNFVIFGIEFGIISYFGSWVMCTHSEKKNQTVLFLFDHTINKCYDRRLIDSSDRVQVE